MKRHNNWVSILAFFLSFLMAKTTWAFFGMDAATLVPILTQQLAVASEALSSANDSLKELRDINRGIDKIRNITVGYEDLYGLLAQNQQLVTMSKNLHEIDRSLEELTPLDSTGIENVPNLQYARFNRRLTQAAMVLSEKFKQETVKQEAAEGVKIIDAANQAESGAEAAKINAGATGMLVYQNSEMMALEAQQLQMQAAELEMANTSSKEDIVGQHAELQQLRQGFKNLQPVR